MSIDLNLDGNAGLRFTFALAFPVSQRIAPWSFSAISFAFPLPLAIAIAIAAA